MVAAWAAEEMRAANLKDLRLNRRAAKVLSQLGERPTVSIPAACGGRTDLTAAYRLFDNEKATFTSMLESHSVASRRRVAEQSVAVLVQDTTEVDVTRPEQLVTGAGPLDDGARWGALLHPLHAFTPDGTPLGTLQAKAWVREEKKESCESLSGSRRAAIPIEDKESHRWVEMLRCARQEALHCPSTQLIGVADSEADIYEFLAEGVTEPHEVDWIVRACQNRALQWENEQETGEKHLREQVLAQPVLFTHAIEVRGRKLKVACETRGRRQARQSRKIQVEARAARVRLRPPWRAGLTLPNVSVNVVLVREVNPPQGEVAVEWLLLTSLSVDDAESVRRVIQYYCVRWMIEVFFRVLKSGCRVERRRFEHIDRLLPCVALYLIVAWRTLYVCRVGRSCPDMSCEAVFDPSEWKAAWSVIHRIAPPRTPPRLGDMVRLIAQLGGYVPRPRSDPGPQTIWIGMQRMHDFALCWELFGADAPKTPKNV